MPSVSVVIPVYNGRRYLRRSVTSALDQNHPALEVIIVDDGSTDGAADTVADLLPRLRVIRHGVNRGLSAARNTGVLEARGELVAFLDSDDWWKPERLQEQIELHARNPAIEVSFCDFVQVSETGLPEKWQGGLYRECVSRRISMSALGEAMFELGPDALWALVRYTSFMHPSTIICRRDVFSKAGPFDENLRAVEDLDMWFRLAEHCRLALLDKNLVVVENRADSLGHSTAKMARGMLEVYRRILARRRDMPREVRTVAKRHLARQQLTLSWLARGEGRWRESRQTAWDSLLTSPSLSAAGLACRAALMGVLERPSSSRR